MNGKLIQRIEKFWEGKLSLEEQKQLLEDLQGQDQELYESLRIAFEQQRAEDPALFSEERYVQVLTELHQKMGIQPKRKSVFYMNRWFQVAAMLLCVGVAYLIFQQQSISNFPSEPQIVNEQSIILQNDKAWDQVALLPDHSKIILSPNSRIEYHPSFGKDQRNLDLVGKAQFEVAHDSIRPFVVHAHGYSTTALGTVFIVESYSTEEMAVKLLSGKVVVKKEKIQGQQMRPQYLSPGDQLAVVNDQFHFVPKPNPMVSTKRAAVVLPKSTSPVVETLVFDNKPLSEVFQQLAIVKAVHIDVDSKILEGKTFSGEYKANENLEQMIQLICQMNDLQFEKQGDHFVISMLSKSLTY